MGMKVSIPVKNAAEALDLKSQVDQVTNDFTWRFIPNEYDGWDLLSSTQPTAEFEFTDEQWVTYFQLRWTK